GDPRSGSLAGKPQLPGTFVDGVANAVIFAEGYGSCGPLGGSLWANIDLSNGKPHSHLPPMCGSADNRGSAPKAKTGQLFPAKRGEAAVCNYTANRAFQVTPDFRVCSPSTLQSLHPGGTNVMLGDASVRFVSEKVSVTTWNQACDPRDGNA